MTNANVDEKAEERKELIKRWLGSLGFTVDEYRNPNAVFGFGAKAGGDQIGVYQPIDQPDLVVITARLDLRAYSELFSNRRNSNRKSLLWELMAALLDTNLAFDREGDPVQWVNLSEHIYSDGLTKDRFAQAILKVQLAVRRIFLVLDREMKKPVPVWRPPYVR